MQASAYGPLNHVMDLLLDAVCVVDADGRFVFASAAFERIFGYTPQEIVGRPMIDLVFPADRARTLQAASEIMAGQPKLHFQNRYVRKDGQVVHIMWSARWSPADGVRIAVARDITELKRAESMQAALHAISEAAHASEDLLGLFRHIHQVIGELLPAHNFFVALYDREKDELSFPYFIDALGEAPAPRKLDSATFTAKVIRSGQALLLTSAEWAGLPDCVGPPLGWPFVEWLGVPLSSQRGVIGALVVQSYSGEVRYTEQDKTLLQFVSTQVAAAIERKQTETWLQHIARHDALTGLPNRELFHDRLQAALARARRDGERLSLLYIDLDRFKQVNDNFGHATGDLLLQQVAQRIGQCVREADTVARVGGDEFVVLLHRIARPHDAQAIAEKIRGALAQPFDVAEHVLEIASSIGIALHPEHGDDNKQLIRHADNAMYDAKKRGGNRFLLADMPVDTPSAAGAESPTRAAGPSGASRPSTAGP